MALCCSGCKPTAVSNKSAVPSKHCELQHDDARFWNVELVFTTVTSAFAGLQKHLSAMKHWDADEDGHHIAFATDAPGKKVRASGLSAVQH